MNNREMAESVIEQLRFCDKTIDNSLVCLSNQLVAEEVCLPSYKVSTEMSECAKSFYNLTDPKDENEFTHDWVSNMTSDKFTEKYRNYLKGSGVDNGVLVANLFKWRNDYYAIFEGILESLGIDLNSVVRLGTAADVESTLLSLVETICNIVPSEMSDPKNKWQEELVDDWANKSMSPEEFAEKYHEYTEN